MAKADLTAQRLRELLNYDPDTGVFTWVKPNSNRVKPGDVAGSVSEGRVNMIVDGGRYKAHRLAWLYVYGKWPQLTIDHINGNPSDNRILNLRDVSHQVNLENATRPRSTNSAQVLGVHWEPRTKKWVAMLQVRGVSQRVGRFKTLEEARDAYLAAKRRHHEGCTI